MSAADHWSSRGADYATEMAGADHAHRPSVVRSLIAPCRTEAGLVVDCGCGKGVLLRENPLHWAQKLKRYGFDEDRLGFMNFHPHPPLLGQATTYQDTLNVAFRSAMEAGVSLEH